MVEREVSRGRSSRASGEGLNGEESETDVNLGGKWPQMSRSLELPLEDTGEARRVERSGEESKAVSDTERSGATTIGTLRLRL